MTDKMTLEKKRGISIQSTPISFTYKDVKVNLIDTPGHVEFVAEVERAMSILDAAVLVISAKEGVQSHTSLLFDSLKRLTIPVLIFVNKVDRMGVDIDAVIKEIKTELCSDIIILQDYDKGLQVAENYTSTDLLEDLSMYDEVLLERYINEESIDMDQIIHILKPLIASNQVYPLCLGSALKGGGMKELLDAIVELLPKVNINQTGQVSGVVFKILRDKNNNREIYIRLYNGSLVSRGYIGDEKISFIKKLDQGKLEYAKFAFGNDIVVIMGPE